MIQIENTSKGYLVTFGAWRFLFSRDEKKNAYLIEGSAGPAFVSVDERRIARTRARCAMLNAGHPIIE